MKKVLLFWVAVLVTVCVNAQYQLPNGDFENWPGESTSVPDGWHTFNTATGSLASMVSSAVQHERAAGHSGQFSCCIKPRNAFMGIIANGNFTTGRVHAGSISASDVTGNYNFSDISEGYCQTFTGYPDSLSFWASLYATDASLEASLTAIIHGNYAMHDPIDDNSKAVASISKYFSRTTSSAGGVVWQNFRTKFNYDDYSSYNQTVQYILITFTTNKTPGQGNTSDRLYMDDIEMIYVGEMTDIKVNGSTVANFDPDTYSYDVYYTDNIPTVTATAASAIANAKNQVSITQASADNNYTATINRLGSDITYTIHFIENPDISVEDYAMAHEISFFPNPTNTTLHIRGKRMAQIEVVSLDGRLLFSGAPDSPDFTALDVTQFATGHYTVRITLDDGKTVSGKIVVKR